MVRNGFRPSTVFSLSLPPEVPSARPLLKCFRELRRRRFASLFVQLHSILAVGLIHAAAAAAAAAATAAAAAA